jgi:tetratricopeptide (TPR) repeat protein
MRPLIKIGTIASSEPPGLSRRSVLQAIKLWTIALSVGLAAITFPARGEEPGLPELDEATQLKLTAKTFDDLGKVVEKCESAVKKGLNDENKKFATTLITSSLMQRATGFSEAIFRRTGADARWRKLRELAMEDLQRALRHDSKYGPAHLLIGRLQSLPGGDSKQAKAAFDEAVKLAENDEAKAEALVARASFAENPDQRLADLNEALKISPRDANILRARGMFHFERNNPESAKAAETDFKALVDLDAKNPESHQLLGVAQLMLNKHDEAIATFSRAIELAKDTPAVAEYYINRARAHAVKGDIEKALADADAALGKAPNDILALLLRARLYQIQKEYDKAMADAKKILRLRPGMIAGIELRAGINAAQGKYEEAIEDLELLRQDNPKDKERLMQLAIIYQAAKKYRMAIARFDELVKLDPSDWQARYHRGDAQLSIGKHAEAIADYDEAIKRQPDHTGLLNNLAWVLATSPSDNLRNAKRSIELGKKACELTKYKRPHIISTLAAGYAEAGQWDEALKWSQKALETAEEDDENRPQLLKELESYKNKKPWREIQNEEAEPGSPPKKPQEKKPDGKKPKPPEPKE